MKSTRTLLVTAFAAVISLGFTYAPQGQNPRANAQDEDTTLLLSTYSDLAGTNWPGSTAGGIGTMNDDPTAIVVGTPRPPVQTEPNTPQGNVLPPAPVEPISPFLP